MSDKLYPISDSSICKSRDVKIYKIVYSPKGYTHCETKYCIGYSTFTEYLKRLFGEGARDVIVNEVIPITQEDVQSWSI